MTSHLPPGNKRRRCTTCPRTYWLCLCCSRPFLLRHPCSATTIISKSCVARCHAWLLRPPPAATALPQENMNTGPVPKTTSATCALPQPVFERARTCSRSTVLRGPSARNTTHKTVESTLHVTLASGAANAEAEQGNKQRTHCGTQYRCPGSLLCYYESEWVHRCDWWCPPPSSPSAPQCHPCPRTYWEC